MIAANHVTRRARTTRERVILVTETLTGRLIKLDGEVFHFETDQGERILFSLLETSGVQPHDLEGIVRSPVRIEITIEGPHEHATAIRVEPHKQHHPEPPSARAGLGLYLVDEGVLTFDQLRSALARQWELRQFGAPPKLGEILVATGLVREVDVEHALFAQQRARDQAAHSRA